MMIMNNPKFLVVDLFCGAGGTTTGFVQAKYLDKDGMLKSAAKVVACVNHDPVQIQSHWANHPEVRHFEEDIRTLDLTELKLVVQEQRLLYPNSLLILWASLECTSFSNAKGGQPRDPDSRTLAEHLPRYVEAIHPDYVQIENVVEFMSWGPLDDNGKPLSRNKGEDFENWRLTMKSHGFHDEWKSLNSADYGAHTRRNRLFGCFAKEGLPIIWPLPTHHKLAENGLHKWRPVREVLDFETEGESIINRKRPLAEASLKRVLKGLLKFVGKDSFLKLYYSSGGNIADVDSPSPTLTTKDRIALVQPEYFINRDFSSGQPAQDIDLPAGSITSVPKMNLVGTEYFILNPSHGGHCSDINLPCVVVVARQDKAPLYLIKATNGKMSVPIYEGDSETMIAIKQFMADNGISDIKMRSLQVKELLKIQGFPSSYKLKGNQTQQKKGIGNAVVPHVVKAWTESKAKQLVLN